MMRLQNVALLMAPCQAFTSVEADTESSRLLIESKVTNPPVHVLYIELIEANNLMDRDGWLKGLSDPYAEVYFYQGFKKRVLCKSDHVQGTLNPVWRQICPTFLHGKLADTLKVKFNVWDDDVIGSDYLIREREESLNLNQIGEWSKVQTIKDCHWEDCGTGGCERCDRTGQMQFFKYRYMVEDVTGKYTKETLQKNTSVVGIDL